LAIGLTAPRVHPGQENGPLKGLSDGPELMALPITGQFNRLRSEAILLKVARLYATDPNSVAADAVDHLQPALL